MRVKKYSHRAILNRQRVRRYRYNYKDKENSKEEDVTDFLNVSLSRDQNGKSLQEMLRSWINGFNISMRAVNALLKISIISGIISL